MQETYTETRDVTDNGGNVFSCTYSLSYDPNTAKVSFSPTADPLPIHTFPSIQIFPFIHIFLPIHILVATCLAAPTYSLMIQTKPRHPSLYPSNHPHVFLPSIHTFPSNYIFPIGKFPFVHIFPSIHILKRCTDKRAVLAVTQTQMENKQKSC